MDLSQLGGDGVWAGGQGGLPAGRPCDRPRGMRWFDRRMAVSLVGDHGRPRVVGRREFLTFASLFERLQEARHTADYDHGAEFPKALTLTHVTEAQRAVDLLTRHARDEDFAALWAMIAFAQRR